ncbi:hypothetical protein TPA0908_03060 [Micromonospora sp. AKA38]|nr:hypothetical protein TPA0908_03060 [Micromonospora sp. AKA38]
MLSRHGMCVRPGPHPIDLRAGLAMLSMTACTARQAGCAVNVRGFGNGASKGSRPAALAAIPTTAWLSHRRGLTESPAQHPAVPVTRDGRGEGRAHAAHTFRPRARAGDFGMSSPPGADAVPFLRTAEGPEQIRPRGAAGPGALQA